MSTEDIKINLIMPMGGGGTRFGMNGFKVPKPLIDLNGYPFFCWATESIRADHQLESLTFVVLQEHVDSFFIDKEISYYYPEAKIVVIPEVLPGAVLTAIEGAKVIENDSPILINDCDHYFSCSSFAAAVKAKNRDDFDGGLLTFKSSDPAFSYVRYDEKGNMVGTLEKIVVSEDAICGAYYFKNKQIFMEAANAYLDKCSYREFFMSGVYNILAQQGRLLKSFTVDFHVPFGTPDEYERACKNEKITNASIKICKRLRLNCF